MKAQDEIAMLAEMVEKLMVTITLHLEVEKRLMAIIKANTDVA